MTILKKLNLAVSVLNCVLFLIPLVPMLFSAFYYSDDGLKTAVVVMYFLVYIWTCVPGIISLRAYIRKYDNKIFNIIMLILNIVALYLMLYTFYIPAFSPTRVLSP